MLRSLITTGRRSGSDWAKSATGGRAEPVQRDLTLPSGSPNPLRTAKKSQDLRCINLCWHNKNIGQRDLIPLCSNLEMQCLSGQRLRGYMSYNTLHSFCLFLFPNCFAVPMSLLSHAPWLWILSSSWLPASPPSVPLQRRELWHVVPRLSWGPGSEWLSGR